MLKTAPYWNPNLSSAVADADQKQAKSKNFFGCRDDYLQVPLLP